MDRILEIDREYASFPSPELYKKRLSLQSEFQLLSTSETTNRLRRAKATYYEHGERAGKLLARQIKETTASRLITEIRKDTGQSTFDPQEINHIFKRFYVKLYSSESINDPACIEQFFESLDIPSLSIEDRDILEQWLTINEIKQAISNMQSSKAPGPDSFTTEFYISFSDQISPLLLEVFNESLEKGCLPPTFYQANISLIHKVDKDPLDPGSYRPISLLDVDNKILAKVLATRLAKALPTVISTDQTGFIRNILLFLNIRILLNIIYTPSPNPSQPEVLIFFFLSSFLFSLLYHFLSSNINHLHMEEYNCTLQSDFCWIFFSLCTNLKKKNNKENVKKKKKK